MGRKINKFILVLFVFGFLIRLAFVLGLSYELKYDELDYDNLAWNIAKGDGYINTERIPAGHLAARPPGYPLFLAALYLIFGHSLMMVRFMQAIISALLIVLIYIIGREAFNERVARLSAALASIYPFFIYYSGQLQSEILCAFCLALAVLFGGRFIKGPNIKNGALFGIFIGLTGLVRPVFILYGGFIIFALIASNNFSLGKALKLWLLVLAVVAVTFSPWVIRNYIRLGAFIPGTTWGGEALYVSSHPTANGSPGPNLYDEELVKIRKQVKGEVAIDRYFHKKAVGFIIDNPRHYLWLIGKRFIKIWNIFPDAGGRARLFSLFSFGLLLPFFILGFMRALMSNKAIMPAVSIFYVSLVFPILFYGSTRLRFPVESFILLFASSGLTMSWSHFFERFLKRMKHLFMHSGRVFDFMQYSCPFVIRFTRLKKELIQNKANTMLQQGRSLNRVLDYGCATGHISRLFDKDKYLGIDIDQDYIDFARKRYPDKKFLLVENSVIPFPDNHFDLILMLSTVHHIPDNQINEVLREARRVLKSGGSLVIIDNPPAAKHKDFIVRFILKQDIGDCLRDREALVGILEKYFEIETFEEKKAGGYILYFVDLRKP